jgi:hypothetical protein
MYAIPPNVSKWRIADWGAVIKLFWEYAKAYLPFIEDRDNYKDSTSNANKAGRELRYWRYKKEETLKRGRRLRLHLSYLESKRRTHP